MKSWKKKSRERGSITRPTPSACSDWPSRIIVASNSFESWFKLTLLIWELWQESMCEWWNEFVKSGHLFSFTQIFPSISFSSFYWLNTKVASTNLSTGMSFHWVSSLLLWVAGIACATTSDLAWGAANLNTRKTGAILTVISTRP